MKCPESASYSVDDRQFHADFLDPVDENNGDCNHSDITDEFIELDEVTLAKAQASSLHHLAGYCLVSIKKRENSL